MINRLEYRPPSSERKLYRIVSEAPLPFRGREMISSLAFCSLYVAARRHLVVFPGMTAEVAMECCGGDLDKGNAQEFC